jgi:hypothetical protein
MISPFFSLHIISANAWSVIPSKVKPVFLNTSSFTVSLSSSLISPSSSTQALGSNVVGNKRRWTGSSVSR